MKKMIASIVCLLLLIGGAIWCMKYERSGESGEESQAGECEAGHDHAAAQRGVGRTRGGGDGADRSWGGSGSGGDAASRDAAAMGGCRGEEGPGRAAFETWGQGNKRDAGDRGG